MTELPLLTAGNADPPRKACAMSLPQSPFCESGSRNIFQRPLNPLPSNYGGFIRQIHRGRPLCHRQGPADNTELQAEPEMTPRTGP